LLLCLSLRRASSGGGGYRGQPEEPACGRGGAERRASIGHGIELRAQSRASGAALPGETSTWVADGDGRREGNGSALVMVEGKVTSARRQISAA
jgi:hypothetical protein